MFTPYILLIITSNSSQTVNYLLINYNIRKLKFYTTENYIEHLKRIKKSTYCDLTIMYEIIYKLQNVLNCLF